MDLFGEVVYFHMRSDPKNLVRTARTIPSFEQMEPSQEVFVI